MARIPDHSAQTLAQTLWKRLEAGHFHSYGRVSQHSDEYHERVLSFRDGQALYTTRHVSRSGQDTEERSMSLGELDAWLRELPEWQRQSYASWCGYIS